MKYCPSCSGSNGYHYIDCPSMVRVTKPEARRIVKLLMADERPSCHLLAEKFKAAT